jgi:hypothetical protein
MAKATIERRIYFFRVDSDPDPKTGAPTPFDAKGIFTALKAEPFMETIVRKRGVSIALGAIGGRCGRESACPRSS